VVADVISPRERGRYQGYFASVFALASVAGPVLGGMFAQYLSWTMIFWINIPLGLLAIVIARGALAHLPAKGVSHHIDYLGSVLMATGTICLLLALTGADILTPGCRCRSSRCLPRRWCRRPVPSPAERRDRAAAAFEPARQSGHPDDVDPRFMVMVDLCRRQRVCAALLGVRARDGRLRFGHGADRADGRRGGWRVESPGNTLRFSASTSYRR